MNFIFMLGGLVFVVGGVYWLWRLSHPKENEEKTEADRRRIDIDYRLYRTKKADVLRAIFAILFGVMFIIFGLIF